MTRDRFEGCLVGLALGDALGAPREGGLLERLVWRAIGKTRAGALRWTDDTQMSLDLAESLIARGGFDADDVAGRFARSYRWNRGYGPGTAKLLNRVRRGEPWRSARLAVFPGGSFGNGGAMRAPAIALFAVRKGLDEISLARESAAITHAHALGQEGAALIAGAVAGALASRSVSDLLAIASGVCTSEEFTYRCTRARTYFESGNEIDPTQIARELGRGVAAVDSCVTALYCGLRHLDRPFVDLMDFVAQVGGDVDTIGAMAGGIWGAANGIGALPTQHMSRLEQVERIRSTAAGLFAV